VLSGCVITYVASEREITLREYALSRVARIYSVAIPALLFCILADQTFIAAGNEADLPLYQYKSFWKYLILDLSFTTDHWFIGEDAFSIGGWWSLSYEVWYYVLFATAFFTRGWKRWMGTAVVALVIGPKLLALFPLWIAGSFVYLLQQRTQLRPRLAMAIMMGSVLSVVLAIEADASSGINDWADALSGDWISTHLRFSQWFLGDILLGVLFAASIFAARFARLNFGAWHDPIRYVASFTFTFYLVHGVVLRSCVRQLGLGLVPTTIAVIGFSFLFGLATEHRKDQLRRLLSFLLSLSAVKLRRWLVM
jgi:peptidoglycan/LPS O-acetylase OafA/YrhL